MSSRVEICNLALGAIGQNAIEHPDEHSAEAIHCKRVYDFVRRTVLRVHPWNFALKVAPLAKTVEPPQFGYSFRYQLPHDCLYPIEIANGLTPVSSGEVYNVSGRKGRLYMTKVMGKELLANMDAAELAYTSNIEDATYFTDSFVEAFSFLLAARLSMLITKNANIQKNMMEMFQVALAGAQGIDARENNEEESETIISCRG